MSTNSDNLFDLSETSSVLSRFKQVMGIKREGELAEVLGVSASTLSGWKADNSTPYARLDAVCQDRGISLEYVLHNAGPQKVADVIAEPTPAYAPPLIQFDLYLAIARTIDALFKEAQVQVGNEITQDKRDHLIAYCYNQHIKDGIDAVELDRVRESVELVI